MQEGKKQRIEFLDYLKAVCVIMVIITHYGWEDKTSPFFTMLINMAVPVFMIVSGYNFAMSNRKKADGNLEKMYGWNMMKPKLIRFLLPFFAICLLEILLLAAQDKNIPLFRIFVLGAYGPGSYYVPIMLQLLVIFPLIYVMIAYNAKLGLAVAALANLAFEVCVIVFDMDKYYYPPEHRKIPALNRVWLLSVSASGAEGKAVSDVDDVSGRTGISDCSFRIRQGFRVVWLLEDDSDAGCVLYFPDRYFIVPEILSLYDSGICGETAHTDWKSFLSYLPDSDGILSL